MLILRLQRIGKKKQPSYRLIVSEKVHDTQGGYLEALGKYNPTAKPKVIDFKMDRVKYWIGCGAQASSTVHNLLVNAGAVTGRKARSVRVSKNRKAKMAKKNETKN